MNTPATATEIISVVARNDRQHGVVPVIPKRFSAGFVVLSYCISYLGALTTLELLMRRTSMRGLYNWYLLIGASISLGGIAVWSMHYIGNYAIILELGDDQRDRQIVYSPGFTALSFFLPIVVVFLAFCAVGYDNNVSFARIIIRGILVGFGICAMHYVGQAGIANYTCVYKPGFVILSVVIACLSSTVALGLFFMFRSAWNSSWWKRGTVAFILATGVSGMHWVASVETQYRPKMAKPSAPASSPIVTVIAVLIISIIGCIVLVALSLLTKGRRAGAARKAQQVVLAAAIFNKERRLLVSPEGNLPTRKITNAYLERASPMLQHVVHFANSSTVSKRRFWRLASKFSLDLQDKLQLGWELFCVAAADLAADLKQPVQSLGMLYDEIVVSGLKDSEHWRVKRKSTDSNDIERQGFNPTDLGKGKFLFLVKSVDRREADHLEAAGFRFGIVPKVVPIIAASLRMGHHDLSSRLEMMCNYSNKYKMLDPGVYIALFTARASIASGFEVLVRKDSKNQLPAVQLPYHSLADWQLDYLRQMENFKVSACIQFLQTAAMLSSPSEREQDFARTLKSTLEGLMDQISDEFFNDAVLIAEPIQAPCRDYRESSPPSTAQLITFRIIVSIHTRAPGRIWVFTPMSFFKTQQHVYQNSPDHATFAAKTHREFAPIIDLPGPVGCPVKRKHIDKAIDEAIELECVSKSASILNPLEEEPGPKTFVDELFQICIRTREGATFDPW
ncbi:Signaling protein [Lachnellula occidentalis]|uniref:Signaling protein n=1 Tax=Lachnellula occidentalis TaxID=215460 RepID=A0A8H8UKA0_9HELO|nr:Signaling protein [Lachnellula occidentalis]